jgi:hypothetical protein
MDMDVEQRSEIINKRILKSAKYTDLQDEEICRLYVYAGTRRPNGNYLSAIKNL